MENKNRVDVFINVHKGLRWGLFGLSLKLGSLDWTDVEEIQAVEVDFSDMINFLREHAKNEDTVQVPFLEGRVPGATCRMTEDHRRLEKEVDELEEAWAQVYATPSSKEGYALYLRFNRFLSNYLVHMDLEEREITEVIYRNFMDEAIQMEFKKIVARTNPQDMGMMLSQMIPGMNHSERLVFLDGLKAVVSAAVFENVKALAQRVLTSRDWKKLLSQLN